MPPEGKAGGEALLHLQGPLQGGGELGELVLQVQNLHPHRPPPLHGPAPLPALLVADGKGVHGGKPGAAAKRVDGLLEGLELLLGALRLLGEGPVFGLLRFQGQGKPPRLLGEGVEPGLEGPHLPGPVPEVEVHPRPEGEEDQEEAHGPAGKGEGPAPPAASGEEEGVPDRPPFHPRKYTTPRGPKRTRPGSARDGPGLGPGTRFLGSPPGCATGLGT